MVKKNTPMMSSSDTKHRFSLSVEGGGGQTYTQKSWQAKQKQKQNNFYVWHVNLKRMSIFNFKKNPDVPWLLFYATYFGPP